jgi:ribose/xylose/arabinose/galactoside ABC-type transport system permease subunit
MSDIEINGSALRSLEYASRRSGLNAARAILRNSLFLLFLILAIVLTIGGFFVPNVFQPTNLANVLRIVSIVGLVALGETLVLLTGEIDLSVGSIMSLSLVVGGLLLDQGSGWSLSVTLMTGLLLGLINGVAVAVGKVPSLIMTLGTLSVYGGLANVVAVGQAKYLYGLESYLWTGRGYIVGIPVPVVIFLLMILTCFLFQTFSKLGRNVYYTGANKLAAYYSGISVERVKIAVFGLAGFFAAVAGPMYASQTNRVTPLQGVGFELSAIAIAVLGGTSIEGARGSVIGTLIGALIYGFLLNILALSGIGTYMEQVLKGAMLVVIVLAFQKILGRRGSL